MANTIRTNEENEIIDKVLDWSLDNPFTFTLISLGLLYLGYKISKALFYPIQALNIILQLIERFK
ncbi:hypothetical protein [Thermococcus sp. EP1]|uniref:hypothetical protein n=1 Tax=Thermococcus sp. EP1 TaxID=1591054 RepID=UPI000A683E28|nr:hypothetical protein [Thermococcus sp. EP1]